MLLERNKVSRSFGSYLTLYQIPETTPIMYYLEMSSNVLTGFFDFDSYENITFIITSEELI